VRYVLKLSSIALIVAAAWGTHAVHGVFAQTVEQMAPSCSPVAAYPGYPFYAGYPYAAAGQGFGGQVSCQVAVPDQELIQDATVFAEPATYDGIDPQTCTGVNGGGYTTEAISNPIPFSYTSEFLNSTACAFEVMSGTVPPGYPVGSFNLLGPVPTIELQSLICADPSCGAAPSVSYYTPTPTVVYAPAPTTYYTPAAPAVIYTAPSTTYTPPSGDNDSDGGQWHNGDDGQSQDQHWNGNGQWQGSHWNGVSGQGQGSDSSNTQANGGQSDDPNKHHDDHGSGDQQSGGSGSGASSGSSDPNPHHDDHGSSTQSSGSGTGSGSGDPNPHHDDHSSGNQQAGGSGSGAGSGTGSGSDAGHHQHGDGGSGH